MPAQQLTMENSTPLWAAGPSAFLSRVGPSWVFASKGSAMGSVKGCKLCSGHRCGWCWSSSREPSVPAVMALLGWFGSWWKVDHFSCYFT